MEKIASIMPTGRLFILKGVNLDSTYKNTFSPKFFGNAEKQAQFFMSKEKMHFDKVTPVRLQNVIRVPTVSDNIIECNYIMFQNADSYPKWYYAFITQIDWISISECHIHFELDVIQTNLFTFNLGECFINRQHSNSDVIGSNLYPENIELGEFNISGFYKTFNTNKWGIMIASIYQASGALAEGYVYGGVYSGVSYVYCQDVETANKYIKMLNDENKQDGIVAIYMCPTIAFDRDVVKVKVTIPKKYDNISGYTPKNAKLYTSPFNFLYVSNGQGQTATYQYEYFNSQQCEFNCYLECTPSMTFVLVPLNYKGVEENWNEKLDLQINIPCSYNTDYYKAWLAQHNTEMGVKNLAMAASGITAIAGAVTGNVAMMASGGFGVGSGILERVQSVSQAKVQPAQIHGNTSAVINYSEGQFEFAFYQMQVQQEFARVADSVFSSTGYTLNEVGVPDINSRPSYNYTETANAIVRGEVCLQHRKVIEEALNNGITWWHGDWIGDYTRGN